VQSQQLPTESQVLEDEVLLERKALTNQPRKCRSDTIIAGIISEKSESSFAPSHSFCRCTTFLRGTAVSFSPASPPDVGKKAIAAKNEKFHAQCPGLKVLSYSAKYKDLQIYDGIACELGEHEAQYKLSADAPPIPLAR
jgi:hypothetical protein